MFIFVRTAIFGNKSIRLPSDSSASKIDQSLLPNLAEFFKEQDESISIVAADPENSIVADAVIKGSYSYDGGSWLVEGVGEDFIPDNLNLSLSPQ